MTVVATQVQGHHGSPREPGISCCVIRPSTKATASVRSSGIVSPPATAPSSDGHRHEAQPRCGEEAPRPGRASSRNSGCQQALGIGCQQALGSSTWHHLTPCGKQALEKQAETEKKPGEAREVSKGEKGRKAFWKKPGRGAASVRSACGESSEGVLSGANWWSRLECPQVTLSTHGSPEHPALSCGETGPWATGGTCSPWRHALFPALLQLLCSNTCSCVHRVFPAHPPSPTQSL